MIQDRYVCAYYKLIGKSKKKKMLRFILRHLANFHLKYALKLNRGCFCCSSKEGDVIISLTSFPARINNLWMVIETLLRQTVKPKIIYIWLSKDQFPDFSVIPESLKRMSGRGVEIRLVDNDIRSHKKYYYVFKEHPNDLILLADDDIIYPSNLIESLIAARQKSNADKVVSHKYGYRIKHNPDGSLMPYNSWGAFYSAYEGDDLFFGSGGGTLIRPADLLPDVLNIHLALRLCPIADDIWLNAMAKMGGCHYVKVKDGPILPVLCKNDKPLFMHNIRNNQNDCQIQAISDFYKKEIYKNIF